MTSYVTSYLTSSLKSYLNSTSYVKSYLTSYVTSYLTSYVVSDVTRLLYEVLKIGLESAALGLRPRTALSTPRSQFFTTRTDPKPANHLFMFSPPSQINFFILSLPPAQTRRALQMQ